MGLIMKWILSPLLLCVRLRIFWISDALLEERNSDIDIIAKIENQKASTIWMRLSRWRTAMVARGDLGVEIPTEEVSGAKADDR